MPSIQISDETHRSLVTLVAVLQQVLQIPPGDQAASPPIRKGRRGRGNIRHAPKRLRRILEGNKYILEFEGGPRQQWSLPRMSDRAGIRRVTHGAEKFVLENEGTKGQANGARKKLTDAGYHIRN